MSRTPTTGPALPVQADWRYVTRTFRLLEHVFTIRSTNAELGVHLDGLLGHASVPGQPKTWYSIVDGLPGPRPYALFVDEERAIDTDTAYVVTAYLQWHVNQSVIRRSHQRYVMVHAAVAGWAGTGVVMPAPQESGKTTLVTALVERGFDYLSDEAAAIDPTTLRVVPFPKPVSIDRGSWTLFARHEPRIDPAVRAYLGDQWQVSPEALRRHSVSGPVHPRLLILPRYVAGARTELEPLGRPEALLATLRETFLFGRSGRRDFETLGRLLNRVDSYRLVVNDLDDACRVMIDLAGGRHDRGEPHGRLPSMS